MRLRIVAAQVDQEIFRAQVDLIRSSGADYDGETRVWWHNHADITPDELNALFESARRYGTHITALHG